MGIVLALVVSTSTAHYSYFIETHMVLQICSSTSGGHFSPGVTITYMLFRKFPVKKGLRYIVAQILGSYVACLIIYVQYHHLIVVSLSIP